MDGATIDNWPPLLGGRLGLNRIGVLVYDGDHTTSFGDGLFAVPVGALWG